METQVDRLRIGPYRLVSPLAGGVMAERWMALCEQTQATHLAYRFKLSGDRGEQRRFLASIEELSDLKNPHILPIEQFALDQAGGISGASAAWIVTPFTGSLEGLVTLGSLLKQKGDRMPPAEAERALLHLLEATEYAHGEGFVHGPIGLDEVLVDRRGSLMIELYGLRRKMLGFLERSAPEAARDEIRAIVEIGYRLVTGLAAEEPRIPASRLVPKLSKRWDDWFDQGLDPLVGFGAAGEASAMLPCNRRDIEGTEGTGPVRTVISAFRQALRSRR